MLSVQKVDTQYKTPNYKKELAKTTLNKEDDGIFASFARKKGMDGLANFLRDDWSENMARKAGWDNFADWIGNKEALENPNKKESFISKGLRAMVKHPVLTIVSIATVAFCGVKLYNHLNKAPQAISSTSAAVDDTIKVTQAPKPVVTPPPELEPTKENIEMLTTKINQGLIYEKEINYSNIEILQDLPEDSRKRVINHLNYHFDDRRNFLYFATGETPATLQCVDSNMDNVFRALENDKIDVANLFWDKGGELVINKKAIRSVISDNADFFKTRLGLAAEATIEDIEKELFCCSYSSPLRGRERYADLMELILGNDIDDARHIQIVRDIKKQFDRYFYPGKAGSIEEYRELLKKSLLRADSSYSQMDKSFIEDLIKKIDALPEESFKRIVTEPIEVFQNPKSELIEFRRMVRLAEKLEKAQKYGTTLKFE